MPFSLCNLQRAFWPNLQVQSTQITHVRAESQEMNFIQAPRLAVSRAVLLLQGSVIGPCQLRAFLCVSFADGSQTPTTKRKFLSPEHQQVFSVIKPFYLHFQKIFPNLGRNQISGHLQHHLTEKAGGQYLSKTYLRMISRRLMFRDEEKPGLNCRLRNETLLNALYRLYKGVSLLIVFQVKISRI